MKIRAIGSNVLCRRVMLKKKNPVSEIIVPGEDGVMRQPGAIFAGIVANVGEECKWVKAKDVVIFNLRAKAMSAGQDETECIFDEKDLIGVVEDMEDWEGDESKEAFEAPANPALVYPMPKDAPRGTPGKPRRR